MLTYGDVLRLAPPILEGLNANLADSRGDRLRVQFSVTTAQRQADACGLSLILVDADGTDVAEENYAVPAGLDEKGLRLLFANAQQSLLLKLADQLQ